MIRLAVFIIALLLAVGAVEAESSWLITLAVLSGIALVFSGRPRRLRFRGLRAWAGGPWADESDW